ncbi:hypothetical protein ACP6H6_15920 [Vibrio harveyi]
MNLEQTLLRQTTLDNELFKRISSSLGKITDPAKAYDALAKKQKVSVSKVIRALDSGQAELLSAADGMFKELYAHQHCHSIVESLCNLLDADDKISAEIITMIDLDETPAHWLVRFDYNNNTYFADAYGIYSDVEAIQNRYANTTIKEISVYEPGDSENPLYGTYTDMRMEVLDEIECYVDENFEGLDMDEKHDLIDLFLDKEALHVIESIFSRDLENSPSI